MVELTITRKINANADKVWAIIGDFGNLSWLPGPDKVEVIGNDAGMIRRLLVSGMDPFDELLSARDAEQKTFTYTIAKNTVIPFHNYVADVTVSAGTASTAQVTWHCDFDNGDIPEADAKSMLEGSYHMLLDALAVAIESE